MRTSFLARVTHHPAARLPLPPTPDAMPDPVARRAALLQRRGAIELMLLEREGDENGHIHWTVAVGTTLLKAALLATGLWGRGYRNGKAVHLRRVTWEHPALPKALDGLTILHLADLHYRRADDGFAEAVEALLDGVEADLCLMTGDYRFGHMGATDHVEGHLARLMPRLKIRHGCHAILGNHDMLAIASAFPRLGIAHLFNEGVSIAINGVPVWIAGTDDSHVFACSDIGAACHGKGEGDFTIAMLHTPEEIPQAQAAGVHVYLCGHTHGGQIRLPLVGALISNARCAREHKHGAWRVGEMFGLTSAGLGTTDLPVRFNCPAEAHLITLRCAG